MWMQTIMTGGGVSMYMNQNYKEIRKRCKASGTLYEDDVFPASNASLYLSENSNHARRNRTIEWKRPKELCESPSLFVDGLDPDDVVQGSVGNCWFVASCAVIAGNKKLLQHVIPQAKEQNWHETGSDDDNKYPYLGVFLFRFFRFSEWIDVVIDDRLPTCGGKLIYIQSKSNNEFWSALLEKAYAKIAGSYEALDSGNSADALVDFTGGVCEEINLSTRDAADDSLLWKTLVKAQSRGALMSTSIDASERNREESTAMGLVIGHAYSLIQIHTVKMPGIPGLRDTHDLVRLRNPWGRGEWSGAWSDNSTEWTAISKRERKKAGLVIDEDDGSFFMSFEDLCKEFTRILICRVVNTSILSIRRTWNLYAFQSNWSGSNAGGCINNKATFLNNPQYLLSLSTEDTIIIALMQRDTRNSDGSNLNIGYHVMKVEVNRKYRLTRIMPSVDSNKFMNAREVVNRFELTEGRYVIVPSTFEPNITGDFFLRVYTGFSSRCTELIGERPKKTFFRKLPVGVLRVKVAEATDLEKQDWIGEGADPFVKAIVEGKKAFTPVMKSTLTPKWNADMVFYLVRPEKAIIKLQIWNYNLVKNTVLGYGKIEVGEFLNRPGQALQITQRLVGKKKNKPLSGSLVCNIEWTPTLEKC